MTFRLADFYDTELRWLQPHFDAAFHVRREDRVLDIGCGAGQTTREVARRAIDGKVLGVDVSADLLRAARERSAGLRNVAYELGDAQMHALPRAHFDLCISRFGTMFFADPSAAFANIAASLRPGARLALMVWQAREHNPWSTGIQRALGQDDAAATKRGAFSQADRGDTTRLLLDAGFDDVVFADVRAPVCYGDSVDAAFDVVAALFDTDGALGNEDTRHAVHRLLSEHLTDDGVCFDARAWVITARRS